MKKDVFEALDYFYGCGLIDNFSGDDRHYIEILMKYSADKAKIELA